MSQKIYAVLGGPFPGVHAEMPRTSAAVTAPTFPIVIKCASEADAKKVAQLHVLLKGVNQRTAMREDVAALFIRKPDDDHVDISKGPYYAVVVGNHVAVFHQWLDVDRATVGWARPKWCKFDAVEDAIAYLVRKGVPAGSEDKNIPSQSNARDATKANSTPSKHIRNGSNLGRQVRFEDMGTGPSTSAQTPKGDNVEDALSDRSTQSESLPRPAFSTKDFPRPYQPPSSITRGSDMAKGHAVVLRYVRGLVGITGVVTKSSRDLYDEPTAPTGLGESVDVYLNAHGYDADAKLHIMYAWRENSGIADFVSYLCGKGMVVSEVKWLWRLITENF